MLFEYKSRQIYLQEGTPSSNLGHEYNALLLIKAFSLVGNLLLGTHEYLHCVNPFNPYEPVYAYIYVPQTLWASLPAFAMVCQKPCESLKRLT